MSKVPDVNEAQFRAQVVGSSVPVVVDFYATWCPPCKMLAPILDRLAEDFDGRVRFVKVNVDEEAGLAGAYGISGVPTLKLFNGGQVRETIVGLVPPQTLASKLEALAAAASAAGASS
jgi:thioredoxin 1